MILTKNAKIVFAGDSVTDDGRKYPVGEGDGLGNGYVSLIDTFLAVDYPELNLHLVNMGIGGNTSRDLLARWDTDVNALNPDRVVVLIGINDVWRQFDSPTNPEASVLPEEYESNLNAICDNTKAKLIFMTPYYLETNVNDAMRKRCDEYAAICKKVANARDIPVIDLQAAFEQILKYRYPAYIMWDRVHPGRIGSMIIARAFLQKIKAIIYIPDGTEQEKALSRTTHLCIAAHQDDIEFMAFSPIAECFGSKDKYFCGVVTTDGAGSPRNGLYENYTDEYMKAIRIDEQKKAAAVGEYTAQILLGYSSNEVKDKNNGQVIKDYVEILKATKPEYVYIHNLADKHNTHVATAVNAIKALRQLQPDDRPKKAYGCEVWRDLDWLNDDEKILLDCSGHQNLARALSSVFDSQIIGGKRYDVAVEGRRLANATFGQSHSCDTYAALNYAMDLTPLIHDETIDIAEYVTGYIQRFSDNVKANLNKLS